MIPSLLMPSLVIVMTHQSEGILVPLSLIELLQLSFKKLEFSLEIQDDTCTAVPETAKQHEALVAGAERRKTRISLGLLFNFTLCSACLPVD